MVPKDENKVKLEDVPYSSGLDLIAQKQLKLLITFMSRILFWSTFTGILGLRIHVYDRIPIINYTCKVDLWRNFCFLTEIEFLKTFVPMGHMKIS